MEEEEIEYIRGVAARKVKRLSADDKTASRRPAASKGARAVSLARSSSTNLRCSFCSLSPLAPAAKFRETSQGERAAPAIDKVRVH